MSDQNQEEQLLADVDNMDLELGENQEQQLLADVDMELELRKSSSEDEEDEEYDEITGKFLYAIAALDRGFESQ